MRLAFHGTRKKSRDDIVKNGFDDEKMGMATDKGYIGEGHYCTPNPEYACAYLPSGASSDLFISQIHDF